MYELQATETTKKLVVVVTAQGITLKLVNK